jgi:hypothetical protein
MAAALKNKSIERYVIEGVRELNLQWLELLAARGTGGGDELSRMLQQHGAAVRQRAARCPVALLDFEFGNAEYWRQWPVNVVLDAAPALPSIDGMAQRAVDVARSALTLAWWSARADGRTAEAILGIAPEVSALIRELELAQIEYIARCGHGEIRPRWVEGRFIEQLLRVAKRDRPRSRRAIHLRGLQWIAGECTRRRMAGIAGTSVRTHCISP